MFASILLTLSFTAGADFPPYVTPHDRFIWSGPTKHTCFPCGSPFFGYTPTSWRPWPVAGPLMVPADYQPGMTGPINQSLPPAQALPENNHELPREVLPQPRPIESKGL